MENKSCTSLDHLWVKIRIVDRGVEILSVDVPFDRPLWSVNDVVIFRMTSLGEDARCRVVQILHHADEEGPVDTVITLEADERITFRNV